MSDEYIWTLDTSLLDHVMELTRRKTNETITEQDYLEKLRSLGFPQTAKPGDHIRIRFVRRREYSHGSERADH